MNIRATATLLFVLAAGAAAQAGAQTADRTPPAGPPETAIPPPTDATAGQPDEVESAEPVLESADEKAPDEAGNGVEGAAENDSAVVDGAAEAAEIKATMERFVPSEQISEDRSVSFPNDI